MSGKEISMDTSTNIMTKKCKFLVEAGICNGKSCKTCHYNNFPQKQEIAQTINYGAVKRYNKGANGKTYRTEVMRF